MIKKAVIVAAGLSSRLYPLTLDKPKGLLEVDGQAMLKRSIEILKDNGIEQIAIVVGYKQDIIKRELGEGITYIVNPFYKKCNNMGSLWFAKSFVDNDPFVYLHGDIIYDERILAQTIQNSHEKNHDVELVTDFGPTDEEAMKVKVDSNNFLLESHKGLTSLESAGEWTGIAYVYNPRALFNEIENIMLQGELEVYDSYAFTKLVQDGHKIYCSSTEGYPWIEVDFLSDYEKAKGMFGNE